MAITKKPVRTRQQRIRARPAIVDWSGTLAMVQQKLGRFERSLYGVLDAGLGQLLRIIDGNATPDELQPERDFVRFNGSGVTVTSPAGKSYVNVEIGGAYTGVDGVDVDNTNEKVRASRDTLTVTLTASQNDYAPTGWDTADILFLTTTSIRVISGFAAPTSPDGTRQKVVTNDSDSSSDIFLSHQSGSSAAANRIVLPGNVSSLALSPGESAIMVYLDSRWYVTAVARDVQSLIVTDHGALSGLGDDDHTQYLLVSGGRALGGNWSLGGFNLTDADTITFNGTGSSIGNIQDIALVTNGTGDIDVNDGTISAIDTATFNGAGSAINTVQSIAMLTGGSATIDMNTGDINDIGVLQINDSDSHTGPATGMVEVVGYSGPDSALPGGMLRHFSDLFLWNFPIDTQIDTSAVASDTLVSTINFASVAGYNLTDRVIRVRVHLQSMRTDGDDTAYGTQDSEVEFTIDTNQSGNANVAERDMEGIVNASPFDPVVIRKYTAPSVSSITTITAVPTSGTTVVFTGSIQGAGTRRAMMVVEIRFCYV